MSLGIGIVGISGKMGQKLVALIQKDPRFHLSGGYSKSNNSSLGDLVRTSDLLLDFSHPSLLPFLLQEALLFSKPIVIGTTGLQKEDMLLLQNASKEIPILYSANFSLGIAICKRIAEEISALLGPNVSVDIVDIHHTQKKDAPSGTALSLKEKTDPYLSKQASISSIRAGSIIGEHILYFTTGEERITLSHEAQTRDLFAKGALEAALFLQQKKPSLYSMEDYLQEKNEKNSHKKS
jgi:4-hydroxy-tetrahydrodipicolinate reductase